MKALKIKFDMFNWRKQLSFWPKQGNFLKCTEKTLNYRLFKNKFEFENYFNILDDRDIFTFCRFRLNNHKLGNSEFAIYATQQILEMSSITMYLLKCDYFSEKRKTYIDKKYFKNCNILKFGTLMNQTKKIKNKKTLHLYKIY